MKKNNKKGFAIAEILAVTVAIMVIFVTVYSNFFPTTAEFERRMAYNDLESLYATYYMRQLYNGKFSDKSEFNTNYYYILYDGSSCQNIDATKKDKCDEIAKSLGIKEMIVTTNNIKNLKGELKNIGDSSISPDLKKYIKYLPEYSVTSTTEEEFRIILKTENGYATSLLNYSAPIEANEPLLIDDLLPIEYDDAGSIVLVDKNKSDWYDYDEGKWANAVTLVRNPSKNYSIGDVINKDDINTMWVWIPRYKYSLFNYNAKGTDSVSIQSINIEFEKDVESTGTIKCSDLTDYDNNESGVSEICKYQDGTEINESNQKTYQGGNNNTPATYTHPAFTFGDTELTGIWVGKFENSLSQLQKSDGSTVTKAITILPESNTYIGFKMYEAYQKIREMESSNNPYGFNQKSNVTYNVVHKNDDGNYTGTDQLDNDENNLDIHMMKNSEWGVVTYLALSKYGIYNTKNGEFKIKNGTSNLQANISIDNYSGACSDGGCKTGKISNQGQSTTKNYYGIYDMSGGVPELMMASTTGDKFGLIYGYSSIWAHNKYGVGVGNIGSGIYLSKSKYYDKYAYNENVYQLQLGKLGDATKETSWYIEDGKKIDGWITNDIKQLPTVTNNTTVFSRGDKNIIFFVGSDGLGTSVEKVGSRSVLVINRNGGTL